MRITQTLIIAGLALLAGPLSSVATIKVEAWYHLGETNDFFADSSGNSRRLGLAFSTCNGGGNPGVVLVRNGASGPLGDTGFVSTNSLRFGFNGCQGAMWGAGAAGGDNTGWNPGLTNYGIEVWALPVNNGINGGNNPFIFSSGRSGGLAIRARDVGDGTVSVYASIIGGPDFGEPVIVDTNSWTHFAIVNVDGVSTFYVNGVQSGEPDVGNATLPAGDVHVGAAPFVNNAFEGFIDEARIFTFNSGEFSVTNLLLRPPGPSIVSQPQDAVVWEGGSTPFEVNVSFDSAVEYQWQRNSADLPGENSARLYLPLVTLSDSGQQFRSVLTKDSLSLTTAMATLTVVPRRTADVNYYRAGVLDESSLVAFFPVDGSTDLTVTNVVNPGLSGQLEFNATYDGRTNRAFGERALAFNGDGDVQVPNHSVFEFGNEATVEALIYMDRATSDNPTIFSWAQDGGPIGYAFQASRDGALLLYNTDGGTALSWPVPASLIGRLAHVAFVISEGTNLTAYLNGQSLGTKAQAGYGAASGAPAWIGARGTTDANRWVGSIDELAVYSSALPINKIQVHYSRFAFGTNVSPPSVTGQPGNKTFLAGAAPILSLATAGTLPISYQWSSNGVALPGANLPVLRAASSPANTTVSYVLWMTNAIGWTSSTPIQLTFTAATGAYAQTVLQDGPSSFWRLDEATGTLAHDYAGFNDAEYKGALTMGVPGATPDPNTAVHLEGGFAEAPHSPSLNPNGPFTIEFWAKPDRSGQINLAAIGNQNRAIGRSGYAIYQGLNGNQWETHIGDGATVQIWLYSQTQPVANQWYHVAVAYSGTNTARLYVNGKDDTRSDSDTEGNYLPNSAAPFQIGNRAALASAYPGAIDDVAFYSYALTAEQLNRHFKVGMPLRMSIAPAANLVLDTKPAGTPLHAVNGGAAWTASNNDGTRTRNGVMQFVGDENDQITLAANSSFNSTAGTLSFWIRSEAVGGSGSEGAMLFDRRTATGVVLVQKDDGTLFVQTVPGAANSFSSSSSVTDNKWHHVAMVYDQTSGMEVVLYIDGVRDAANANTADWTWPATQQIEFGRSHDGYWKKFNGFMDDVRLYDRVLDDFEVGQLAADNLVDEAALKVRLNFDEPPKAGYAFSWFPDGTLQVADDIKGPFTDVPEATSPLRLMPSEPKKFFRAKE